MKHTAKLDPSIKDSAGRSLLVRAMGRFYTPYLIGGNLAQSLVGSLDFQRLKRVRLIDPFCGDGRLLVAFIHRARELGRGLNIPWEVALWDYDSAAVELARKVVAATAEEAGIHATLTPICHDSFLSASEYYGSYDCVITNPPWEAIKPDRRELAGMSPDECREYRTALREYDLELAEVLPHSQPLRKFAGWGTNLSRCGTELTLRLASKNGLCGIVTPLSLLMDQMSSPIRQWMFENATLLDLAYYPAQAKLFQGVDQDCVAFTMRKARPTDSFETTLRRFDRNGSLDSKETLELSASVLKSIDYCVPVNFGRTYLDMMAKWKPLNTVRDLENRGQNSLWTGRELDETRHKRYLSKSGQYAFLKGRMVGRYVVLEQPSEFVREDLCKVPESASKYRIAWRDVSRRSQTRRMQAALIPPGIVTGNSVHVAYFRASDLQRLRALLTVVNSIPFEFQVRSRLGTGHISLGVVRRAHIPFLDDTNLVDALSSGLADLEAQSPDAEIKLEVLVARAYGLNRVEYGRILECFEGLPGNYVSDLLSHPIWGDDFLTFKNGSSDR